MTMDPGYSPLIEHWMLDREVVFLNHGSFGACPRAVLEAQARLRERLEREPVRFFVREWEPLLDDARGALAAFVGADPADLAFVPNATAGVNTVLRSLPLFPGDELLVSDQEYNACRNALVAAAGRSGARVVVVNVPFPLRSPDQVVEAIEERITARTRLLLVDHVTSQTGLVQPVERILASVERRAGDLGIPPIEVVVDGAHAPGMVSLDLGALRPSFYTGNCHKWICAPKGAGFLFVRRDRQNDVMPLAVSHGLNATRSDRSRFHLLFDWTGTGDPTPYLAVGEAVRFMGTLLPGGWPALRERNRLLALAARKLLAERLGVSMPAPEEMIGSLATLPLPDAPPYTRGTTGFDAEVDRLGNALFTRFGIEVPIMNWPAPPRRMVRVSAQAYNTLPQYGRLAEALAALIAEGI